MEYRHRKATLMTQLVDTKTKRTLRRPAPAVVAPAATVADRRQNVRMAPHQKTGVVFEVLLGAAACLSLVAVVQSARTPTVAGPDASPPAVFVQTD